MMQRSLSLQPCFHVAIIMDGNGRWAQARILPRIAGHAEGAKAVRRIVEVAPHLGITTLTLFAFSADNWQRPKSEVNALMRLFYDHLLSERNNCQKNGVRLSVIGRRDRLPEHLTRVIEDSESATVDGKRLHLRLAVDYSGREAILGAAGHVSGSCSRETFSRLLAEAVHAPTPAPDVDLVIRTGGEQRLSDFMLWECACAELYFTPRMWPEFDAADLSAAVDNFHRRERRFGRISEPAAEVLRRQEPPETDQVPFLH